MSGWLIARYLVFHKATQSRSYPLLSLSNRLPLQGVISNRTGPSKPEGTGSQRVASKGR